MKNILYVMISLGVVWGCDLNDHQPRYYAPRGLLGTIFGEVQNLALQCVKPICHDEGTPG